MEKMPLSQFALQKQYRSFTPQLNLVPGGGGGGEAGGVKKGMEKRQNNITITIIIIMN